MRDTRQNAESSRSHQIVRIFVESRPSLPAMPEGDPFHWSLMKPTTSMTLLCSAVSVSVKLLCMHMFLPLQARQISCMLCHDQYHDEGQFHGNALQRCPLRWGNQPSLWGCLQQAPAGIAVRSILSLLAISSSSSAMSSLLLTLGFQGITREHQPLFPLSEG